VILQHWRYSSCPSALSYPELAEISSGEEDQRSNTGLTLYEILSLSLSLSLRVTPTHTHAEACAPCFLEVDMSYA